MFFILQKIFEKNSNIKFRGKGLNFHFEVSQNENSTKKFYLSEAAFEIASLIFPTK